MRSLAPATALLGALLLVAAPGAALAQTGSPAGERASDGADSGASTGPWDFAFKGQDAYGNKASLDEKGLAISSADDSLKFRVGGKIQFDFGTAGLRGRRLSGDFDDASAFRRTWFESYLTILDSVELAFQYDFADSTRPINDAVVAFTALDPFIFSLGNMKEPFSLSQLVSDNNTLFTERSLADAFAPARNFGFAIGANGESWTVVAGVFGGNANTGIEDGGVAGTARLTYAPILSKDEVLHLGIAGSFRSLDRDGQSYAVSVRPESYLFATALANTGTIRGADTTSRIGLEAAYQIGGFRLQGEYNWSNVTRTGGLPTADFDGGYIEAGWMVNGNGRPYTLKPKYGTTYAIFGAPEVDNAHRVTRGGIGVFELGARVSYIDLNDRAAQATATVRGGREVDYTFGLNWYPEPNLKIAADYVRAHATGTPDMSRDVDADIFVGRVQVYW